MVDLLHFEIAALAVVIGALCMRQLWILFLAVMNLKQAEDENQLHGFARGVGKTVLVEGLLWDFFVQVTVASFIWLEFPRELTVSARVARLCAGKDGWRKDRAIWFRDTLLKIFDRSGGHG